MIGKIKRLLKIDLYPWTVSLTVTHNITFKNFTNGKFSIACATD